MTKIIDLPTTASTDANTFVPVYKNGKTQKVSATALGGGGSGLDLTSTTDVPSVEGTEYIPLNKPLGTVLRVTVQRILDWILARANTWTGVQTIDADMVFSGAGRKIIGDFSNATINNRLLVQTSTPNGATSFRVIPSNTATSSAVQAGNTSDANNQGVLSLAISSTIATIRSHANGTGTLLPLSFEVGNAERLRIDTSGNVLVTGGGGLGYGVGSGGAVVQATSKSTAVTLNKPSGQITMNNGALGANATVAFSLNNTFINGESDLLVKIKGGSVDNAAYQVWAFGAAAGSISIAVRNISNVTLSESIVLEFKVIQGTNS